MIHPIGAVFSVNNHHPWLLAYLEGFCHNCPTPVVRTLLTAPQPLHGAVRLMAHGKHNGIRTSPIWRYGRSSDPRKSVHRKESQRSPQSQRQQVEFESPTWSPSDVQTERKTAVPAVWSIARMTVSDGAPPRRNVVYVASERLAKVRASSMPPYATSPLTPTAPDLLAASVQPQPLPPRAFPRRLSRPSPPHARQ